MRKLSDVIGLDDLDWQAVHPLAPANYLKNERTELQPRLEALGYIFISWHNGEMDSFGPVTRICRAMAPDGEMVEFYYGHSSDDVL